MAPGNNNGNNNIIFGPWVSPHAMQALPVHESLALASEPLIPESCAHEAKKKAKWRNIRVLRKKALGPWP